MNQEVEAGGPTGRAVPPDGKPGRPRRWYKRPRWIALAIVVVLACGATAFRIRWSHRGAHEASIDQAVKAFRKQHGASSGGFLRPASGVYTFAGTGTERLSLLHTTQHWGPRIPVTVAADRQGCWKFRVDYSTHHWQSTRYCPSGRVLRQSHETVYQTFDFVALKVSDTNVTVCNPPIDRIRLDAAPGERWRSSCTGRSTSRGTKFSADGTDTFLGIDKIQVGSDLVPAYKYSVERTLRGSQTGTERYEMWYSVLNAFPVKTDRHVIVHSPSPIGTVTYSENGSYVLTSLTPRR